MMLILKFTFIFALFLAPPSSSQLIKSQYKWDEDVKFCSFSLHIIFNLICANGYDDKKLEEVRFKHHIIDYENLHEDCCEQSCTPLDILKNYCIASKSVDITKDLIIFPDMEEIDNTKPINTSSASILQKRHTRSITMNKLLYCYMGFKKFCDVGSQQAISDMINDIRHLRTYQR